MTAQPPCSDLGAFVDDELEAATADRFRDHLDTCTTCRARLVDQMQIDARLTVLAAAKAPAPPSPLHTIDQ